MICVGLLSWFLLFQFDEFDQEILKILVFFVIV